MFEELNKYKHSGHFFYKVSDTLTEVCNAPSDKGGVYIMYALKKGKVELVYIGRSGEMKPDGTFFVRKAGLGGLKDRLINGKQFGEARRTSLKRKMLEEEIEALDIYWFVTQDAECDDCPKVLENQLLAKHIALYGNLPRWNHSFFK